MDNINERDSRKVLVLDFDDVIMATGHLVDAEIKKINFRASGQYQRDITKQFQSGEIDFETYRVLLEEHFDLKDRVLEEVDPEFRGRIDYSKIISPQNFYPNVVDYINYLVRCGRYDEVYIESLYNVSSEAKHKAEIIKKYMPGVKFIPVPFHRVPYKVGLKRQRTNKALYIQEYLNRCGIENYTLIDDSNSNVKEWIEAGGIGINFNAQSNDINKLHNLNPFYISVQEYYSVPKLSDGRKK